MMRRALSLEDGHHDPPQSIGNSAVKVTPEEPPQKKVRVSISSPPNHPENSSTRGLIRRVTHEKPSPPTRVNAKRELYFDSSPQPSPSEEFTQATQPFLLSQHLSEPEPASHFVQLSDEHNGGVFTLSNGKVEANGVKERFTVGRHYTSQVRTNLAEVSNHHAELVVHKLDESVELVPLRDCFVLRDGKWVKYNSQHPNKKFRAAHLYHQDKFRLLPPFSTDNASTHFEEGGYQFMVMRASNPGSSGLVASSSFDKQYQVLLGLIQHKGTSQKNKKGTSKTLRSSFIFDISLEDEDDRSLLPLTTLRKLFQGTQAFVETMWMLRGDSDISFLQSNGNRFWDAQADSEGWVGLSYSLLVNFPSDRGPPNNQLEEKVLQPLCNGKVSRNMNCTLVKPGEPTVQPACTSGIQFAVSKRDNDEFLNLTVTQRSSDVVLGLPHDVVVWSILLHLVRREVRKRCGRVLKAGMLHFVIAAGGAHIYDLNQEEASELHERRIPIDNVMPVMHLESSKGIFEMAATYAREHGVYRVTGYGKEAYHPILKIKQATE